MACTRYVCAVAAAAVVLWLAFLEAQPAPAIPSSYWVPRNRLQWRAWSTRWQQHAQCKGVDLDSRLEAAETPVCGAADPDCVAQRKQIAHSLARMPDDSVSGGGPDAWDYGMQPGFLRSVGARWADSLKPAREGDNASTSAMGKAWAAAGESVFFCAAGLRTFAWRRRGVRVPLASVASLLAGATEAGAGPMVVEPGAAEALAEASALLQWDAGRRPSPLLVFLHGWPSGPGEYAPVMGSLGRLHTDDASVPSVVFDVLVPALPGFGWSAPAVAAGGGRLPPDAPGEAWELRRRGPDGVDMATWLAAVPRALGYVPWEAVDIGAASTPGYLPSGGDYGGLIAGVLAQAEVPGAMLGAHLAMWPVQARRPSTLLRTAAAALLPPPLAAVARALGLALDKGDTDRLGRGSLLSVARGIALHSGYLHQQATFPDTLAAVLHGNAVSTAAWVLDKLVAWQGRCYDARPGAEFDGPLQCFDARYPLLPALMMVQDHVRSVQAPLRLYRDAIRSPRSVRSLVSRVDTPVALMSMEQETLFRVPFAWAGDKFSAVEQRSSLPGTGHFAGLEEPDAVLADALRFLVARLANERAPEPDADEL